MEFAHIVPWSLTQDDSFANLIVLCAMCHGLYDREKKIPRQSIQTFKDNLALLNGRYSDAERRVLEAFALAPDEDLEVGALTLSSGTEYTVMYLLRDGLIHISASPGAAITVNGVSAAYELMLTLTEEGVGVVRRLREARAIDGDLP